MAERPRDPKTGRFISAKQAEEVNKKLSETQKLLKDIGKDASISAEAFIDIAKSLIEATKGQENLKAAGDQAAATVRKQRDVAKELQGVTVEQLADKKQTNKLLAKELVAKKNLASIESQIAKLAERATTANEADAKVINKMLGDLIGSRDESKNILNNFEKIKKKNDELNSKTKFFDSMAEVVGDIPVIGKVFKDFKEGADKAREAGAKGGSAMAAGFGGVLKAFGKFLFMFTGGTLIKGLFQTNENITQISRNLNVSREAANRLNQSFNKAAQSTKAFAGKDLLKATMELSENLGFTADLSTKSGVAIARLTKKLGLSAEEAGKLTVAAAGTGKNIEDINQKIVGTVMAQNIANKTTIRYQDVLKDVAGTSNATLMTTDKFAGGIAKAAFAARKMGLNLSEVAGISENLLDFESSISAEMEAEVMLGRNLELDRARMAAATGNQAVLAEELNRLQSEGVAFGDMNIFQQQAFAKAIGMSRDQLADSLAKKAALNKLGIDGSKQALRDEIKRAIASGDQAKLDQISAELGEDELIRQEQNKSFAEGQALAMQRLVEVAGQFGDILNPITKMMASFSEYSNSTLGFIGKMSLKLKNVHKAIMPIVKMFKGLAKGITGGVKGIGKMFSILKGGMKTAGKGGIKMVLKKIPILGALVGAGLAYKRFKDGDYLGAGAELVSGIASIFPGIGTAASIAIDSALLAGDMKGVTGANNPDAKRRQADPTSQAYNEDDIFLNDFTIRANPKDTITMAGGTKLGGNVEALLAELIGEVKKGGNVFLDGTSVGDALVLNSRLTN